MTEKALQRPVIVYYPRNVEPGNRYPVGMLAGQTFEAASPAVAEQYHPDAEILRYADGQAYDDKAVKAEIRALAREQAQTADAPQKGTKGSPRPPKGAKGTSTRKSPAKRPTASKEAQTAVKAEIVAKAENQPLPGDDPVSAVDEFAAQTQTTPDGTNFVPAAGPAESD